MLVDEGGHGKGLPLNRRGGELYGADAIAGDVLICQERRTSFSVDELSGFTQEEAERLRDLLFRGSAAAGADRSDTGVMAAEELTRAREGVGAYIASQMPDREVRHLERVGIEHVAGRRHEIWDIHLDNGERWWAVTNPTNCYPQTDFKSRSVVLTFHIGLMAQVMTRYEAPVSEAAKAGFAPVWRRWEQAAEALGSAEEAEHFQAVGTHLRECLISQAHEIQDDDLLPEGAERPKGSNVVAWLELFADAIAAGHGDARLRRYLKDLVQPTWEYQQHLVHNKRAVRWDAEIGLDAVGHLVGVFTAALIRKSFQQASRCSNCEAYAVIAGVCRYCGWEDPSHQAPELRRRSEAETAAALPTPCVPSSDISMFLSPDDVLAAPDAARRRKPSDARVNGRLH